MVRDKLEKSSYAENVGKVRGTSIKMKDMIRDMERKGVKIESPMDMLTEVWNSDLSDYDAAQMLCSVGMMLVKSGHYEDFQDRHAESDVAGSLDDLKEKWGL